MYSRGDESNVDCHKPISRADNQYVAVRIYKFYYDKNPLINGRTATKLRTPPFGTAVCESEGTVQKSKNRDVM